MGLLLSQSCSEKAAARLSPISASRENGSQILSFFCIGNPYGRCVRWNELKVVGDDKSDLLQKKSSKRDGSI